MQLQATGDSVTGDVGWGDLRGHKLCLYYDMLLDLVRR